MIDTIQKKLIKEGVSDARQRLKKIRNRTLRIKKTDLYLETVAVENILRIYVEDNGQYLMNETTYSLNKSYDSTVLETLAGVGLSLVKEWMMAMKGSRYTLPGDKVLPVASRNKKVTIESVIFAMCHRKGCLW